MLFILRSAVFNSHSLLLLLYSYYSIAFIRITSSTLVDFAFSLLCVFETSGTVLVGPGYGYVLLLTCLTPLTLGRP